MHHWCTYFIYPIDDSHCVFQSECKQFCRRKLTTGKQCFLKCELYSYRVGIYAVFFLSKKLKVILLYPILIFGEKQNSLFHRRKSGNYKNEDFIIVIDSMNQQCGSCSYFIPGMSFWKNVSAVYILQMVRKFDDTSSIENKKGYMKEMKGDKLLF